MIDSAAKVGELSRSRWDVDVFDSKYPVFRREIAMLRRLKPAKRICFMNIYGVNLSAIVLGMKYARVTPETYGRLLARMWIRGAEASRRLYAETHWSVIAQTLEIEYGVSTRKRLRWTGRCTLECEVSPTP